ncbi:MAG: phosphotransferase [Bacteroidetes bacterium]|nr:phosphotransferase [Bacteroidota bacterium]
MNPFIEKYYTPKVVEQIAIAFGISANDLKLLRSNIDVIYTYSKDRKKYILRVTHSSVQTVEKLLSEVDWLHYLQQNGANVSAPIESANGNLIEVINTGDTYFTAAAYTEAPGNKIDMYNWNEPVFQEIGRVTGQLHRLTKHYVPGKNVVPRTDYIQTEVASVLANQVNHDKRVIAEMQMIVNRLDGLPKTTNNYGLIHNDINRGNMFIKNGTICLFDTADCAYSWFVTDIALTLLYVVQYFEFNPNGKLPGHIRYFMDYYWAGYLQENTLTQTDLNAIPDIMTMRAIFILNHLKLIWTGKQLNHVQKNFYNLISSFSLETFDFISMELINP